MARARALVHPAIARAQAATCVVTGRHVHNLDLEVTAAVTPPLRLSADDVDAVLTVPVGRIVRHGGTLSPR